MSASAQADYYIKKNWGGYVEQFLKEFKRISTTNEPVRIEGPCMSSCTLILKLPPDKLCMGPNAVLGFHAAWVRSPDGKTRTIERNWTQFLRNWYPQPIARWISAHGGLGKKLILLRGADLLKIYPACSVTRPAGAQVAFAGLEDTSNTYIPWQKPRPQAARKRAVMPLQGINIHSLY